jgi:ParB family chromosome partitioning protein
LEIALIENLQREDLNILEKARSYARLIDEFGSTQDDVARVVGKSRSHIANSLRLLKLPAKIIQLIETGKLTAGHARALVNSEDPERLARDILARRFNVRQTESIVSSKRPKTPCAAQVNDPHHARLADLQPQVSSQLNLPVEIDANSAGGKLILRYSNTVQLEQILCHLSLLDWTAEGDPITQPVSPKSGHNKEGLVELGQEMAR